MDDTELPLTISIDGGPRHPLEYLRTSSDFSDRSCKLKHRRLKMRGYGDVGLPKDSVDVAIYEDGHLYLTGRGMVVDFHSKASIAADPSFFFELTPQPRWAVHELVQR